VTVPAGEAPAAPARPAAPEFYIVGHEKCGTTALHVMLSQHPEVFMPGLKETRFFAPELRSRFLRLGPRVLPETREQYAALFASATPSQRTGEASPSYLRSRSAAARIAEARPDAKIIAIFREPAAFLRSFHLQAVHNHVETEKDLRRALALEPDRRRGKKIPRLSQSPPALLYSDHVRYVEQLRRYEEVFPREQILVLIYEDFRRDNQAVLRKVMRFLEIDEDVELEPEETYRLQSVRSVALLRLQLALGIARRKTSAGGGLIRALGWLIPAPNRNKTLRRLWTKALYGPPPPTDDALMLEMRRRFRPEVEALGEHLGRDLVSLWGYDERGCAGG
jgi:Sulfotransferase domain